MPRGSVVAVERNESNRKEFCPLIWDRGVPNRLPLPRPLGDYFRQEIFILCV